MARNLTAKEALFVHEYLQDGNATKAAKLAGYSAKTAGQAGCRLLKTPKVKAEIDRLSAGAMAKVEQAADAAIERSAVTIERIISSLADMGLAISVLAKFLKVNGGDLEYDFSGATPEELLAIAPMVAELKTERYAEGRGFHTCDTCNGKGEGCESCAGAGKISNVRDVIRSTVKLVDRKAVLELLGRWRKLGMWQPETPGDNHLHIHVTRRVMGDDDSLPLPVIPKRLEQHARG